MRPHKIALIAGSASLIAFTGLAVAQRQQASSPPKARYAMDVGTVTGLAAMGGGMGGAMSMMFGGGGGKEARELRLRLGSTLSPTKGVAQADHFLLPAAKLGKSVPLLTPERVEGEGTPEFQRPKGRLLLFWGCGAKAPKGQPVIIDFAKIAAGQMPPNLYSARIPTDRGPTQSNSRTYGEWPNKKSAKPPAPNSSLLGEHRIAANYAPEIKFALSQDYMPGLTGRANDMPGGAIGLTWNSVTGATGYHAWLMGAKMDGGNAPRDMVWWSSASAREFGGGLWDWLPPETVRRLITEKIIMPPSQTSCTVPAEVKAAAPDFIMGNLYAYGPEANFAYPPRPANPATPWNPEWTARVRYRSHTMWMIGGPMAGNTDDGTKSAPCKPSIFGAVLGKACR
ncbi:MAG: hypothetical protein ABL918_05990 [Chakrabartia sp.]